MLFKVNSSLKEAGEREFFDLNPGASAITEFDCLTTRQMFFVCLVADRDSDSPLRTLPETPRRTKAAIIVGYPLEDGVRLDKNGRNVVAGKVESIEIAIKKYRELQYDESEALEQALDAQVQEVIYMMTVDKEELCTILTTTTNKKTGDVTTEKKIDGKMMVALIRESMKLGAGLPELKEARDKIRSMRPKVDSPISDIMTYTAGDLSHEDPNTEESTIDRVMQKSREV